jgi:hypothetical protein
MEKQLRVVGMGSEQPSKRGTCEPERNLARIGLTLNGGYRSGTAHDFPTTNHWQWLLFNKNRRTLKTKRKNSGVGRRCRSVKSNFHQMCSAI